jgi:hypothetical protein
MPVRGQQPEAEVGAVSVKYERHIGCHTGFAQEILQFGIAYRPIVGVTQVGVGIPEHGAGDVTGLVGSGANVDLDETHGRIIEVGRDPRIVDTRVRQRSYSFHRPASQAVGATPTSMLTRPISPEAGCEPSAGRTLSSRGDSDAPGGRCAIPCLGSSSHRPQQRP